MTLSYTPPWTNSVQPNDNFFLFQWHQYGLTYDSVHGILTAYVDGAAVASQSGLSGPLSTNTNPLVIGGDGVGGNFFRGYIDDVRVYNTASVNMQALGVLGPGVSTVAGTPTALGSLDGLERERPDLDLRGRSRDLDRRQPDE